MTDERRERNQQEERHDRQRSAAREGEAPRQREGTPREGLEERDGGKADRERDE